MPKPTNIGFFRFKDFNLSKYFSTALKSFSFPVVEEEETAYRKPLLNESSFLTRSSLVSGVTKKIKSKPYFLMIEPYSVSYSYSGKSGSISPEIPTSAASLQNFSKPYCNTGFIYPINMIAALLSNERCFN